MKKMNMFKVLGVTLATLVVLIGIHINSDSKASANSENNSILSEKVYKVPEIDHSLITYEQRAEKLESIHQENLIAEAERLAEEKRIVEEARVKAEEIAKVERKKAAKEKGKQHDEDPVAQTASTTPAKKAVETKKKKIQETAAPKKQQVAAKAPAQPVKKAVKKSTPAPKTDGFNYNGHHYPLASFSGSGLVPANNNIYKWTDWYTNHYLIELAGNAGKTIWGVNVGSKVTVNGKTYTVQGRKGKIDRVKDGTDFLVSVSTPDGITFQSCDPGPGDTVTIWWAI